MDVSRQDETSNGQAKISFALVDDSGAWLQCAAIGRNAFAKDLRNNTEVIAYNVSAKTGQNNNAACVWLFKDSMLVGIGQKEVQKKMQVGLSMKNDQQ